MSTGNAQYVAGKPAAGYKATFEQLQEAVQITVHCARALKDAPQAALADVVAKLQRAKV